VIALDDDTTLLAPGGAWLPREEALVVADVHAGYVADLQRRGFALPYGHDDDLLARLDALLHAADPARVVIAGDLVHGPGAAHTRSAAPSPLDRVLDRLRGRAVTVVLGNHDAPVAELLRARGVDCVTHCAVGSHAVVHGDEDTATLAARCESARTAGGRVLLGHVHPALGLRGALGHRARVPAFVAGPALLALPALAPLARGADLYNPEYAAPLTALCPAEALQVLVVAGAEVVPAGSLASLWRLAGVRPQRRRPADPSPKERRSRGVGTRQER